MLSVYVQGPRTYDLWLKEIRLASLTSAFLWAPPWSETISSRLSALTCVYKSGRISPVPLTSAYKLCPMLLWLVRSHPARGVFDPYQEFPSQPVNSFSSSDPESPMPIRSTLGEVRPPIHTFPRSGRHLVRTAVEVIWKNKVVFLRGYAHRSEVCLSHTRRRNGLVRIVASSGL
jgi:hypothetical protein